MQARLSLASSLLLLAAVPAQPQSEYLNLGPGHLKVQVFAEPTLPGETGWTTLTTSNDNYAALQYASTRANAVTLVLAFVVPDPDYQANVNVLAALRSLYPFIDHPPSHWRADARPLLDLNAVFDNSAADSVVIPPARIAAAVTAALSATTSFGPVGATAPTTYTRPEVGENAWPSSVAYTDERHTLSGWWNSTRTIMRIDELGRRALEVAAYQWSSQVHSGAVVEFDAMIRQTYQWAIHLQAVQISPPTGPPPNDRPLLCLSPPVKVRRRSQGALNNDPWLATFGPSRATVYLFMPGQRFYLAGLNELLFVDLADGTVGADCRAYVPIQGGGWATLPRLTTFGNLNLLQLEPATAVFACPGNAVHGIGYMSTADLTPIDPLYPLWGSAENRGFGMYTFFPTLPVEPP